VHLGGAVSSHCTIDSASSEIRPVSTLRADIAGGDRCVGKSVVELCIDCGYMPIGGFVWPYGPWENQSRTRERVHPFSPDVEVLLF